MASTLWQRPILWGGLGITATAWLLHGFDPGVLHLGSTAVWGAVAVGSGLWWFNQTGKSEKIEFEPVRVVDRALLDKAFAQVEHRIEQLVQELAEPAESAIEPEIAASFRQQVADLKSQLDRKAVQIATVGSRSVGKTSLMQLLNLAETTPAQSTEATLRQEEALTDETTAADLVLFVVAGDLTDTEFQTLQQLVRSYHQVLLVFNKQDQYLPADRPVILQQLRERVQDLLPAENVIAVTAAPAPIKVRQYQADGTTQERIEQPEAEVVALQERVQTLLTTQVEALIVATTYRQTQALQQAIQTELNQVRRNRAMPIVEQYQWIAAGTAFANPLPSLDLLATATINAQMVMDLGGLYQQSFSLEQAKTVTGQLAAQMVKLGLVEMATQAITPLLKSHALTYVAGGTLQGISAAYLTRLAGLSLVEYFEEHSQAGATAESFQVDGLIQKLKRVFEENQRSAFLQTLVKQGLQRLAPQTA
jgi:uncharacterized protein